MPKRQYLFRVHATFLDGSAAPAFARPWLRYGYGATEREARAAVMKEFNDAFNPAPGEAVYRFVGSPVVDARRVA